MAGFEGAISAGSAHSLAGLAVPGGAEGIEDQGIGQAQLLGAPDNLMPVVDRRITGV